MSASVRVNREDKEKLENPIIARSVCNRLLWPRY